MQHALSADSQGACIVVWQDCPSCFELCFLYSAVGIGSTLAVSTSGFPVAFADYLNDFIFPALLLLVLCCFVIQVEGQYLHISNVTGQYDDVLLLAGHKCNVQKGTCSMQCCFACSAVVLYVVGTAPCHCRMIGSTIWGGVGMGDRRDLS